MTNRPLIIYRPVSLPPICGKIFEKLIFNSIFKFLDDNNLLSSNQSGLRPSEYQLLSIIHDIYASFGCWPSLEVWGKFLDISRAFYWDWHEGLTYIMQALGISGLQLKCIESFLTNRFQRVLLHGHSSSWSLMLAGMPQGSTLGPLLFLVHINDLSKNLL